MTKPISNLPASVHGRLLSIAKATNRPFSEVLQYFAMERFLYRLSSSKYSKSFILKGALLFKVWNVSTSRPTMDIDFLGKISNDLDEISSVFKEICIQSVQEDGIRFDPSTVKTERIDADADYKGTRVRFTGFLAKSQVPMQIDIGFGDSVVPDPVSLDYPTLLDFPTPHLIGYKPENSIAEKFHVMCNLGMSNSRMKDFYDIWILCRQFDFDGSELSKAIESTFKNRHTDIPTAPIALEPTFTEDKDKVKQWKAFLQKSKMTSAPEDLNKVLANLKSFLGPVAENLSSGKRFKGKWKAPGPWV